MGYFTVDNDDKIWCYTIDINKRVKQWARNYIMLKVNIYITVAKVMPYNFDQVINLLLNLKYHHNFK